MHSVTFHGFHFSETLCPIKLKTEAIGWSHFVAKFKPHLSIIKNTLSLKENMVTWSVSTLQLLKLIFLLYFFSFWVNYQYFSLLSLLVQVKPTDTPGEKPNERNLLTFILNLFQLIYKLSLNFNYLTRWVVS